MDGGVVVLQNFRRIGDENIGDRIFMLLVLIFLLDDEDSNDCLERYSLRRRRFLL